MVYHSVGAFCIYIDVAVHAAAACAAAVGIVQVVCRNPAFNVITCQGSPNIIGPAFIKATFDFTA